MHTQTIESAYTPSRTAMHDSLFAYCILFAYSNCRPIIALSKHDLAEVTRLLIGLYSRVGL